MTGVNTEFKDIIVKKRSIYTLALEVYYRIFKKTSKSWCFKNNVVNLQQQIPPRFPKNSVPGRKFYFDDYYDYGILEASYWPYTANRNTEETKA